MEGFLFFNVSNKKKKQKLLKLKKQKLIFHRGVEVESTLSEGMTVSGGQLDRYLN